MQFGESEWKVIHKREARAFPLAAGIQVVRDVHAAVEFEPPCESALDCTAQALQWYSNWATTGISNGEHK